MRRATQLLPILLAPAIAAQTSIAFVEGPSPTDLRLRVVDEATPGAPGQTILDGIELLPLEITNRTIQMSLRPNRARKVTRAGFERIELPNNGRLLRYRSNGGARYGFLWIDAKGGAQPIFEMAGAGVGGTEDPFQDRFGIGVNGRHAVVATVEGAAFIVRLDGANFASTGTPVRPLEVPGLVCAASFCVGKTHVFFQTEDARLWRSGLGDAAVPEDITPASLPTAILKDEMAQSGDGRSVVFLLGEKKLLEIWMVGTSGSPRKLPAPPADYEEPGYLPEFAGGPLLMLNQDGSRLLYTDSTVREEIYLMDTTGATSTTHITSDPNFSPYIGIGTLPAFSGRFLTIAIGDPDLFDWYSATTERSSVVNLTGTAEEQVPPYGAGTLAPNASYAIANGTLIEESDGAGGKLLRHVDAQGNASVLATSLRAPLELGRAPALPREAHRDSTGFRPGPGTRFAEEHFPVPPQAPLATSVLITSEQGDSLTSTSLRLRVQGPPGVSFSPEQIGPAGFSIFIASNGSGVVAPILRSPTGQLVPLSPDPGLTQALVTARFGILLNGTNLEYLSTALPVVLSSEPVHIVLS